MILIYGILNLLIISYHFLDMSNQRLPSLPLNIQQSQSINLTESTIRSSASKIQSAPFFQNLIWQQEQEHKRAEIKRYYLPYCMRLKIKDITNISYKDATAQVNGSLVININFKNKNVSHQQIDQLRNDISSGLIMQIKGCDQLQLKKGQNIQINVGKQNEDMKITVRRDFKVSINRKYSQILYSPFQKLVLIATFSLHKITVRTEKETKEIYFNSMDFNKDSIYQIISQKKIQIPNNRESFFQKWLPFLKLKRLTQSEKDIKPKVEPRTIIKDFHIREESIKLYCEHLRLSSQLGATYGDYKLSTRLRSVQSSEKPFYRDEDHLFTSKPKEEKKLEMVKPRADKKVFCSEFTHFCFVLYQDPVVLVFTILIPLIFLGLISLVVFFLQHDLTQRVGIIATLLLGFIQILPSIRDQLIDKTKFFAIQIITGLYTLACLLSLIDSFYPIDVLEKTVHNHYTLWRLLQSNILFVISVIINISCLFFALAGLCYFNLIYKRSQLSVPSFYRRSKEMEDEEQEPRYTNEQGNFFLKMSDSQRRRIPDFIKLRDILQIPTIYQSRYSHCWNNKESRRYFLQKRNTII